MSIIVIILWLTLYGKLEFFFNRGGSPIHLAGRIGNEKVGGKPYTITDVPLRRIFDLKTSHMVRDVESNIARSRVVRSCVPLPTYPYDKSSG